MSQDDYHDKTQKFSTWGDKLLQHADVLHSIQNNKMFKPITVQLAPCEMCDSDCPFCSVAARPLKSYLPFDKIVNCLRDFRALGAKGLEITGGGNPMLYRDKEAKKDINDIIDVAHDLGFKIGIITNTEKLGRHLKKDRHEKIQWIRVSLIKLDEGCQPEDYDFDGFPPSRLGMSYIIYDSTNGVPDELSRTKKPSAGTTAESIDRMARLVELNPDIKFVRIAGNALIEGAQVEAREQYGAVLDRLDQHNKFFIKDIGENCIPFDDGCYVGCNRPYIAPHPDGGDYQVYVCTSHVLEKRTYDLDFSVGSVDNVLKIWMDMNASYREKGYPYEVRGNKGRSWKKACGTCLYNNNNKLLHTVANEMPDKDFA
jgi:MoaA/NifB/PqqE/SkfB family radical SAM enzyme